MTLTEREEATRILQARDQGAFTRFVSRKAYEMLQAGAQPEEFDDFVNELGQLVIIQDPDTVDWWQQPCTEPGCNGVHLN